MSSLINTIQADSNISFAKNVIENMRNDLSMPLWVVKMLPKERKRIYYELYAKYFEAPNWYENDADSISLLKEFIKHCPYMMAEDYIGFTECWEEDQQEVYKIDCPKIKRQYKKILPIIQKIEKIRTEMKVILKEATKIVQFVDWLTNNDEKLKSLHIAYKADTGENKPFMEFANYLYQNDKSIVNWHNKAA